MTANFPKNIRIGSVDYTVESEEGVSASNALLGYISYGGAEIKVEASLPRSKANEVLAHELAHGVLYEAGYDDHTEEQASRIGKVLAMLLRDNDFGFMKDDNVEMVTEFTSEGLITYPKTTEGE